MSVQANIAESNNSALELWHSRLGYLGIENVIKLSEKDMVIGIGGIHSDGNKSLCEGCIVGKQHKTPYPMNPVNHAAEVLEVTQSDVCGPMSIDALGYSRYFVTFIDDSSIIPAFIS